MLSGDLLKRHSEVIHIHHKEDAVFTYIYVHCVMGAACLTITALNGKKKIILFISSFLLPLPGERKQIFYSLYIIALLLSHQIHIGLPLHRLECIERAHKYWRDSQ